MCPDYRYRLTANDVENGGYVLPAYLDNHDLERVAILTRGNERLLKLGYLILMSLISLPYPVVIYGGSERGQGQTANPPEDTVERDRYFREPTSWVSGHNIAAWIRDIAQMRRSVWRIFTDGQIRLAVDQQSRLLRYSYALGADLIGIIANYGESPAALPIDVDQQCLVMTDEMKYTDAGHVCLEGYQGVMLQTRERQVRNR